MVKAKIRGGKKLKRFQQGLRRTSHAPPQRIEVGFKEHRIAVLAAQLEFGNPSTSLPERPAFRLGVKEMREATREWIAKKMVGDRLKSGNFSLTHEEARELAIYARDIIRDAYKTYHGPGLSERQRERKAGTSFADDELIGHEGPKLIGHIKAYVDDVEVG